jgi:hypothetical protein
MMHCPLQVSMGSSELAAQSSTDLAQYQSDCTLWDDVSHSHFAVLDFFFG